MTPACRNGAPVYLLLSVSGLTVNLCLTFGEVNINRDAVQTSGAPNRQGERHGKRGKRLFLQAYVSRAFGSHTHSRSTCFCMQSCEYAARRGRRHGRISVFDVSNAETCSCGSIHCSGDYHRKRHAVRRQGQICRVRRSWRCTLDLYGQWFRTEIQVPRTLRQGLMLQKQFIFSRII